MLERGIEIRYPTIIILPVKCTVNGEFDPGVIHRLVCHQLLINRYRLRDCDFVLFLPHFDYLQRVHYEFKIILDLNIYYIYIYTYFC